MLILPYLRNNQLISCLLTTLLISASIIQAGQKKVQSFLTPELTISQGTICAIPININPNQQESITTNPTNIIKILRQPAATRDNKLSFAQIKATKTGTTLLTTKNGQQCKITVTPAEANTIQKLQSPRIFSPVINSYVWGTFSVGVEFMADDIPYNLLKQNLLLTLPGGKTVSPSSITTEGTGPMYIASFDVDASQLPQRSADLTVTLLMPDKSARTSNSLRIYKTTPSKETLIKGECEDHINDARPEQFDKNRRKQKVQSVANASGGRYVLNASANPVWTLEFDAKDGGSYQFVVRARGNLAANTFPTIGIYTNEHNRPVRNVRLTNTNWHRLPVGAPLKLDAGKQILSLRFENDFYVTGKADRNLYLDAFEIAKIPDLASDENIQLRFINPINDPLATGQITINGECRWDNPISNATPEVSLIINDNKVATQHSSRPIFKINQSQLKKGDNIISMTASGKDTDRPIITPAYHVQVKAKAITSSTTDNAYYRFSVLDPNWNGTLDAILTADDKKRFREQASFSSKHDATLTLPDELEGKFLLTIEAQGKAFKGKPIATVTVAQGSATSLQHDFPIDSWMHPHKTVDLTLNKGPKSFSITYTNDYYIADKGDRNFYLRSVILTKKEATADKTAPTATITYPASGYTAYKADVVIAECYDDIALRSAELIIDDKPTGIRLRPNNGLGRLIFPLSCRTITPGKHTLQILARDKSGNKTTSPAVTITVTDKQPAKPTQYARAIHILNRFAFGTEPIELANILTLGESKWLDSQLKTSSSNRRKAIYAAEARYPNMNSNYHTVTRALQYMLTTDNPVEARVSLWTQNHFSTWLNKTGATAKWNEYLNFVQAGATTFSELLTVSATSPAMLVYLDQQKSYADSLNENYAREIMELHTLGVDHAYTQQDITELARILTGWTTVEESNIQGMGVRDNRTFRQSPPLNDKENKEFLGMQFSSSAPQQGMSDTIWAIQILAAHPETAKHIAGQLAEYYVASPPPSTLVNKLANEYMRSCGSLSAMLETIMLSPEFMAAINEPRLATPIDYGLHLGRLMRNQPAGDVRNFLLNSGMGLFDRATPDGYSYDDKSYADSNALLQRWKFAAKINWQLKQMIPQNLQQAPKKDHEKWAQQITDILAIRLTGKLLSKQSNQAMLDLLLVKDKKKSDPVSTAIAFICQLPEINLK